MPWTKSPTNPHVHRVGYPVAGGPSADEVLLDIRRHHADCDRGLAAVIVEPIQGTGGNRPPVSGFLAALSDLTADLGALVIADEIVTGFGRTGTMFDSPAQGLRVDIMTIGKGMANGFPMSAMLTSDGVLSATPFASWGALSSTFGGNPLAMVAATATLDVILGDRLADVAREHGSMWLRELSAALAGLPAVRSVHGRGLMVGVQLQLPPDSPQQRLLDAALLNQGLLVGVSGDMLRLNPPLVITPEQLQQATAGLAAALAVLDGSAA